jgi:hypothetical protein
VASWLLSLGCWEPEAKRRHDSLLQCYLSARWLPLGLDAEFRRTYWLAAASNALAGALNYQVAVAAGWTGASRRHRRVARILLALIFVRFGAPSSSGQYEWPTGDTAGVAVPATE